MDRGKVAPNVERAIRRSRSVRAAMRRRRRRNIALTAFLSAALAGAGILAVGGVTGNDMVHAAVSHARSLAELLDQRSPGDRTEAQLTKTKYERALAKQRLAPRSRERLPVSSASPVKNDIPQLAELLAGPGPIALVEEVHPFPEIATSSPPSLGLIVGSPPSTVVTPPGGGGEVPQVTPPFTRELVPTSPLPEPGTWAMMLLGFALIGWRARRERSARPGKPGRLTISF